MTELATAYVSLVVEGSKLGKGAREAGERAGRDYREAFDDAAGKPSRGGPDPAQRERSRRSKSDGDESGKEYAGAFERALKTKVSTAIKALPSVKVDADSGPAQQAIARIRGELESLSRSRVGVDVDSAQASAQIDRIRGELDRLGAESPDIAVKVDTAAASAALTKMRSDVDRLAGQSARVDVDADTGAASAGLGAVASELSALSGRTARVSVDADTGAAQSQLAAFNAATLASSGGMGTLVAAVVALGSALIPIGAAAVPAVAGIGAAAIGAAAGVGVLAMAIVPVVKAMQAMSAADEQATQAAAANSRAAQARATAIASASTQMQSAQRSLSNTRRQVADAAVTAAERVKSAQLGVRDAEQSSARSIQQAQQAVVTAREQGALRVRNALVQVNDAERGVEQAQRGALAAQQSLNAARETAKQNLQDMAMSLKSVALQERSGELQVAEARQRLNEVMSDPKANELQRQQAKLSVDQAVQGLEETRVRQQRLAKEKAAADKAGVNGSKEVRAAQQGVKDANQRVADAQQAVVKAEEGVKTARLEAVRSVQDASQKYEQARVDGARRVAQAQAQVTSAIRAQATQQRQGAAQVVAAQAQVASAQQAMSRAQAMSSTVVNQAAAKAAEAMAALTPAGQSFVKFLRSQMMPQFEQLSRTAQNGLLPGLQQAMKNLTPLFGPLNRVVDVVSRSLGNLFVQASKALTGPFWTQFFTFLGQKAAPWMEMFARTLGYMLQGLAGLFQGLAPLGEAFGRSFEGLMKRFAEWGANGGGQGFQRFLEYAQQSLPIVGAFLGSLGRAFGNVAIAAAPLGTIVLKALTGILNWVASLDTSTIRTFALVVGGLFGAFKLAALGVSLFTIATGPIGLVALAIGGISVALYTAYRNSAAFRDGISKALGVVKDAASGALDMVKQIGGLLFSGQSPSGPFSPDSPVLRFFSQLRDIGSTVWGFISSTFLPGLMELGRVLWDNLGKILGALGNQMVTNVMPGIQAVVGVMTRLAAVVWPVIFAIGKGLLNVLGAVIPVILNIAGPVIGFILQAFAKFYGLVTVVVTWLRDTAWPILSSVFGWIAARATWLYNSAIGPVFGWIKSVIGSVFGWLRDTAWPIVSSVFGWIAGKVTWVYNTIVKPYFGFIKSVIGSVFGWLRDTAWPIFRSVLGWIGSQVVGAWNKWFKPYFGFIKGIIGSVFGWLRDTAWPIFRNVIGWVVSQVKGAYDKWFKPYFGFIKGIIGSVFGWLRDTAWPIFRNVIGWVKDRAVWLYEHGIKPAFDKIKAVIKPVAEWFRDTVGPIFSTAINGIKGAFSTAVGGITTIWHGLINAVKTPIRFVVETILNNGLIKGLNAILPGDDIPPIPTGWLSSSPPKAASPARQSISGANRRLNGFDVGGYTGRGRKFEPAGIVHRDEFVIRKESRKRFESANPGALDHLNRTGVLPGFASGGLAGKLKNAAAWARANGWAVSEFAQEGTNHPGLHMRGSDHNTGLAFDANWPGESGNNSPGERRNWPKFRAYLKSVALGAIYGNKSDHLNHVHVMPPGRAYDAVKSGATFSGDGGGGGIFDVAAKVAEWVSRPLKAVIGRFADNPMAKVPVKVVGSAIGNIKDWVASKVPSFGVGEVIEKVTSSFMAVAKWEPTVRKAMGLLGIPATAENVKATLYRIGKESSGDPNVTQKVSDVNSRSGNHARGLMQVIPPTFRANAMPGYGNILNPLDNLLASMRYAMKRYGSLPAAYNRKGGYAKGTDSASPGWKWVGERGPELMHFKGGEQVIPAHLSARLASLGLDGYAKGTRAARKAAAAALRERKRRAAADRRARLARDKRAASFRNTRAESMSWVSKNATDRLMSVNTSTLKSTFTKLDSLVKSTATARAKVPRGDAAAAKAFGISVADRFSKSTKSLRDSLLRNADAQSKSAASIKSAQESLAAKIQQRDEYAASVKQTVSESGALAGNSEGGYSRRAITDRLRSTLSSWKSFGGKLSKLQRLGLGSAAYSQIVAAGPDEGGEIADVLISGGSGYIKQVNGLQSQITAYGGTLGKQAAGAMYQPGVDAAKGFLDGLMSKDKALENAGRLMAQSLVSAVRKELKIKSPSRVMFAQGEFSGQGFVNGVDSMQSAVSDSLGRLSQQSAAAAPVRVAAAPASAAVAGGPYVTAADLSNAKFRITNDSRGQFAQLVIEGANDYASRGDMAVTR